MLSALRQRSQQLMTCAVSALPSFCALCSARGSAAICPNCRTKFFSGKPLRCSRCAETLPGMTDGGLAVCGNCLRRAPAFDATVVAVDYAPPVDQLVLSLKFGANLALAPLFARLLLDALLDNEASRIAMPTVLTAVPLGPQRLAERGFNQALEIAKPLARSLGIPLYPRLASRVRETGAQSMLHPDERRKNVRHAFSIPNAAIERIKGQHIGIVDDVITTGETLNELAATFKRFGAARITSLVFARTPS